MNDVFSFSRAGYFSITKPFELIEYFKKETSYIVWKIIIDNFKYMMNILHSTKFFEEFRQYLLKFIEPVINIENYNQTCFKNQSYL